MNTPEDVGQAQRRTAPGGGAKRPLTLIHTNNCSNLASMRVSSVFAMPEQAWKQGYQDGLLGVSFCPYQVGTDDSWAWSSGLIEWRAARDIAKP